MLEGIGLVLIGALALIALVALFLVVNVFFEGIISRARIVIEDNHKRAFWIGFVNTLVAAVIVLIFAALGERMSPLFFLPGILVLIFFIPSALFGFIALGQKVGERLFAGAGHIRQHAYGSGVMILACLFPFIGWYVLFPFLLILGFGAFMLVIFQKRADPEPEELVE